MSFLTFSKNVGIISIIFNAGNSKDKPVLVRTINSLLFIKDYLDHMNLEKTSIFLWVNLIYTMLVLSLSQLNRTLCKLILVIACEGSKTSDVYKIHT